MHQRIPLSCGQHTLEDWDTHIKYNQANVRRCFSKQVFLKVRKFHMKTPVLESLFNKVVGLKASRPDVLLKRESSAGAFL